MIYVVVDVSYDYYRFQDNVFATTDIEQARRFAADYSKGVGINMPVIESEDISKSLTNSEARHVWIEYWPTTC